MEVQNNSKSTEMKKEPQKNEHMMKHGLIMMLCCLIPILLIAGLPLFGIKAGALSGLIFLLCPLMHVVMMFMMMKGRSGKTCHARNESDDLNIKTEK